MNDSVDADSLIERSQAVLSLVQHAARRSARSQSVQVIAVSKTRTALEMRRAYEAGLTHFGENRVQEFLAKMQELQDLPLVWHFIGQLQTNKVKDILPHVQFIHSLDRLSLAQEIQKQATRLGISSVQCFIEVNIGAETTKAGVLADDLLSFAEQLRVFPAICVVGLMTVAPPYPEPERVRAVFQELAQAAEKLHKHDLFGVSHPLLSMGMSGDYEIAVEEGADYVRIGTALFGARASV